jgi:BirA family biotin operon repressor/biotin-[acetyl-CoA-carboxylase] ligase
MIKFIAETGSTNSDLMDALRAHQTYAEGFWLVTDRQTDGRGRQGRAWDDGAAAGGASGGNFMGSTIVKLQTGEYPGTSLNLPFSLAVREAIAEFIPDPTQLMLKWPNDVLLRGAKVSGILMELFKFEVVVGIGVNLAHAPAIAGRATIALADVCDEAPQRDAFAKRLVHHVAAELARWRKLGDAGTRPRWLSYAHPVGTRLAVHDAEGARIEGEFMGLAASGALVLHMPDGSERHIHAGDVTLG